MILTGKTAKWTISLLSNFAIFNRNFKVAKFNDAYKLFKSTPTEKLKSSKITTSNILSFKFDIYEAFDLLKEYTAQVDKLEDEHKQLFLNVWDSEQMNRLVGHFSVSLTDQTYSELKHLLSQKVFNEHLGINYNYFISVDLQYDIKKTSQHDRRFSKGMLKYSLISEKDNKERRLKSKFSLTKQEALMICANISYWSGNHHAGAVG